MIFDPDAVPSPRRQELLDRLENRKASPNYKDRNQVSTSMQEDSQSQEEFGSPRRMFLTKKFRTNLRV
jgi:hypothetical protein